MDSRLTLCAVFTAVILTAGCSQPPSSAQKAAAAPAASPMPENALPPRVAQALRKAESVELMSIEPWASRDAPGKRLEGRLILGSTQLSRGDARTAGLVISSAVASFNGMIAACFDPRHALRFRDADHTYVLLICFDCGSLLVFEDGQQIDNVALTGSPQQLNVMLAGAKVPVSRSAEELAARQEREARQPPRSAAPAPERWPYP